MTDANPHPAPQRQFTGWHMLGVLVLFFGTIISVNLFMAFSATRTWTGLVVENSYVASQEFNTKLANANRQQEMGWRGGLNYMSGALVFTLRDADETPLRPKTVTVAISRPIGTDGDQSITLTRAASGDYTAKVALEPGVWNAAIIASFADQPPYEHHARLIVGGAE